MSIKENIKVACPDATDEQVEEAAKRANAHDFISKFPDGYDTDVSLVWQGCPSEAQEAL